MIIIIINFLDIAIAVLLFFLVYYFLRRTEAVKVLSGLLVLYLVYLGSLFIDLERTSFLLQKFFEWSAIGIIVIFHPELRAFLKKIGGFTEFYQEKINFIDEIEKAVYSLSAQKTGALIIFDPQKTIAFQTEDMTEINSTCSSALLETIFFKNTPLHDGAVIIQGDKIAYAGSKLPLSGIKREGLENFGTRHLAAIETSERFDTISIVVSEETGAISIADRRGIKIMNNRISFRSYFEGKKTKKKIFKKK